MGFRFGEFPCHSKTYRSLSSKNVEQDPAEKKKTITSGKVFFSHRRNKVSIYKLLNLILLIRPPMSICVPCPLALEPLHKIFLCRCFGTFWVCPRRFSFALLRLTTCVLWPRSSKWDLSEINTSFQFSVAHCVYYLSNVNILSSERTS